MQIEIYNKLFPAFFWKGINLHPKIENSKPLNSAFNIIDVVGERMNRLTRVKIEVFFLQRRI